MTGPGAITLVLGGARSGKSAHGESLLENSPARLIYLATAQTLDGEMEERVARHRARRGERWITVEEPLDLAGALSRWAVPGHAVLVDCLTLWLTNLMLAETDIDAHIARMTALLPTLPAPVVLIANEVGLGIVPEHRLGRDFRDRAGALNQCLAKLASRVVFVAAGLPLVLKDAPPGGPLR